MYIAYTYANVQKIGLQLLYYNPSSSYIPARRVKKLSDTFITAPPSGFYY